MRCVLLHVLLSSLPLLLYLLEPLQPLITDTIFPPFVFQHARTNLLFRFLFFSTIFFLSLQSALSSLFHPYFAHFPSLSPFPTNNRPPTKLWSLAPAPVNTPFFLTTFSHFDLNWATFLHPDLCNASSVHYIRSYLANWQIWSSLLSTKPLLISERVLNGVYRLSGRTEVVSLESWTHDFLSEELIEAQQLEAQTKYEL